MASFNYTSGSSDNLVDFYDKLCNFLTGAGGAEWTLHFNSSSTDKVFVSSGSDNRLNGIIRLRTQLSGVIDDPVNYHNVFSHVFAEGFNRFNQNTGLAEFEYGPRGPMILNVYPDGHTNNGYTGNLYANCVKSFKDGYIQFGSSSTVFLRRMSTLNAWDMVTHDNHKYIYGVSGGGGGLENTTTQGFTLIDMFKDVNVTFLTGALGANLTAGLFYDKESGEKFIAFLRSSTPNAANSFAYYRLRDLREQVVTAPWGSVGSTSTGIAWDAASRLYVRANTGSLNELYLPTNTFTTLAPMPRDFTAGNTPQFINNITFITQSLCTFGVMSASSMIYMKHGGVSAVYDLMYNINANTWHSHSTEGAIVQIAGVQANKSTWDSRRNFFYSLINSTEFRRDLVTVDIQNHPMQNYSMFTKRAFINQTRIHDVAPSTAYGYREPVYHHNFPKVRVNPTGSTNYWFLGNRDNVVVVTQPHTNFNGHFVMSFGRVDSFSTRPSMLVTETNSLTGSVVLKVDNNVDYSIGETLTLFDKNSNNPVRRVGLMEKYGSSHIRINTAETINVGTLIGDNSCNCAIYDGDDEFLTTNEQPISASCFDGLYNCDPLIYFSSSFNGNYTQNMKQNLSSMAFYQGFSNVEGDFNVKRAPIGFVRNIFALNTDENKSNTSFGQESISFNSLVIDGLKYKVFKSFSKEMLFRSGSSGKKGNFPSIYDYVIGPFGAA